MIHRVAMALLALAGLMSGLASAQPASHGATAVVLPVYVTASGRAVLWDQPNPWRDAWYGDETGASRLFVPFGDLSDVRTINARDALAYSPDRLDRIRQAYRADQVAVVVLREGSVPDVDLITPGVGRREIVVVPRDGSMGAMVQASAQALTRALDATPSVAGLPGGNQTAVGAATPAQPAPAPGGGQAVSTPPASTLSPFATPFDPAVSGIMTVRVAFSSPSDWYTVRDALGRTNAIRLVRMQGITAREALLELQYSGTEAQLEQSLARAGLGLARTGGTPQLIRTQ